MNLLYPMIIFFSFLSYPLVNKVTHFWKASSSIYCSLFLHTGILWFPPAVYRNCIFSLVVKECFGRWLIRGSEKKQWFLYSHFTHQLFYWTKGAVIEEKMQRKHPPQWFHLYSSFSNWKTEPLIIVVKPRFKSRYLLRTYSMKRPTIILFLNYPWWANS